LQGGLRMWGIQITGEEEKIDPAPIPRILGHAHRTVTVRKLGLCTRHGTVPVAYLSTLLDEAAGTIRRKPAGPEIRTISSISHNV
jgi:hypothetical protein